MKEHVINPVRFLVEMDGRSVELEQLPACQVRDTVLPIAERIAMMLSDLSDPIDVAFSIGHEGELSVTLSGSAVAVNEARDVIGDTMRISPKLA